MTFDEFVTVIEGYESDTFSAKGSEITHEEALAVGERLLDNYANNRLDGVLIDGALSDIRPDHGEDEAAADAEADAADSEAEVAGDGETE